MLEDDEPDKRLNIEIKARVDDQERIRRFLLDDGAVFVGEDHQVDTYFAVKAGRLKIREGTTENCLVHYMRPDMQGPKQCEYSIIKFNARDENLLTLKTILTETAGVLTVVEKQREIYFIDNVKFHLDSVEGLGLFFEIEAIGNGDLNLNELRTQCASYLERLGIQKQDLEYSSYSDMISGGRVV